MDGQSISLERKESNGLGTAGFILSLVTLFFGWIPVLGWILWLLGLIFSAVGISKSKKTGTGRGLSIAGLVISLLGAVIVFVLSATLIALAGLSA
jgi:uncharacterized membrane protein